MNQFLTAYTIKETSEMTGIPVGTIRQWEVDFKGLIEIPRDAKGARYYTDIEIESLRQIKAMRDKKLSKDIIRELLAKKNSSGEEEAALTIQPTVPQMNQTEAIETLHSLKEMMAGFEEFKGTLIKELKEEIRQEVRQEVIDEVRREIASSSESQQKLLQERASDTSEQFERISKVMKGMEERHESEMKRRDELLMENMRVLQDIKRERIEQQSTEQNQKKGFWSRIFGD